VGSCFLELARRHGDFAVVGAGALLGVSPTGTIEQARVVLIGVAGTALRISDAEDLLVGQEPGPDSFGEAAEKVRSIIEPLGDIHGSSDYRREVAGVLTRRALTAAATRAGGR
jgi:CO/xanthine dehydrogenase FAD-binding subunit